VSEPTLWSRVLAGMRWTLLLRVIARSVGLVATLVVARVVPIGDLGAYGAILIADQALQALTQLGFTTALVQMQKDPAEYLDTAWTAQVVRSGANYALEFALAPALWRGRSTRRPGVCAPRAMRKRSWGPGTAPTAF